MFLGIKLPERRKREEVRKTIGEGPHPRRKQHGKRNYNESIDGLILGSGENEEQNPKIRVTTSSSGATVLSLS